jgi:hypothetical protein
MALIDLWNSNRSQFDDKQVHQIIGFAGSGKLLDGVFGLRRTTCRSISARASQLICTMEHFLFRQQMGFPNYDNDS